MPDAMTGPGPALQPAWSADRHCRPWSRRSAGLDVGCGTGISGQLFPASYQVSASTPTQGWPNFARGSGLSVEVATSRNGGRRPYLDAVIAAQAWRSVDPVAGAAKAAACCAPRSADGLWNTFQRLPEPARGLRHCVSSGAAGLAHGQVWSRPAGRRLSGRMPLGRPTRCGRRARRRAGAWRLDWSRPYTRDEWVDVVPTFGGHSLLQRRVQAELLAGSTPPSTPLGGGAHGLATVAATATRAPGASR